MESTFTTDLRNVFEMVRKPWDAKQGFEILLVAQPTHKHLATHILPYTVTAAQSQRDSMLSLTTYLSGGSAIGGSNDAAKLSTASFGHKSKTAMVGSQEMWLPSDNNVSLPLISQSVSCMLSTCTQLDNHENITNGLDHLISSLTTAEIKALEQEIIAEVDFQQIQIPMDRHVDFAHGSVGFNIQYWQKQYGDQLLQEQQLSTHAPQTEV